jgi:hypothetical protein
MNNAKSISLKIGKTNVLIKQGDIFTQNGYKVIAFNEYFDTDVGSIISDTSLNGIFIEKYVKNVSQLNKNIEDDTRLAEKKRSIDTNRTSGNKQRYALGSIYKHSDDFLLTAFAKFDSDNRVRITVPEYMEFLMNFWQELDKLYNGKNVAITIFGSGITRFSNGSEPSNQELLELLLLSFKMSGLKLTSQLRIIIPSQKCDEINFYRLKEFEYGV